MRHRIISHRQTRSAAESQQRQQRQAEDGEIVALDPLEQMDADAFELIAADAGQRGVARHVEIVVEKAVGKIAHGQPRGIDAFEQHFAVAHQRQRRMQRVRLPAQAPQLRGRRRAVRPAC